MTEFCKKLTYIKEIQKPKDYRISKNYIVISDWQLLDNLAFNAIKNILSKI